MRDSATAESERWLKATLKSVRDAVIATDTTGRVRLLNRAAERLTGWGVAEAVGRDLPDVLVLSHPVTRTGEDTSSEEWTLIDRKGGRVAVEVGRAGIEGDDGKPAGVVFAIRDITERKRAEERLARARDEALESARLKSAFLNVQQTLSVLSATLESTVDGILVISAEHRIIAFNHRFAEIWGIHESRLSPGQEIDSLGFLRQQLKHPERIWRFPPGEADPDRGHAPLVLELTDGRVFEQYALPHRVAGANVGWVWSYRDVTEQTRSAERLRVSHEIEQQARRIAEQANRAKDEFLGMLGHELRNPLSAVRNALLAAERGESSSSRDRALRIASRQSAQLARLVDDLLDVSRITQGKITLRKETVSLAAIVERALEEARDLLDASGHEHVGVSITDEARVQGDAARLQQIVANLVNNAAKFTKAGGRIDVVVGTEDDQAVVRVRDTGIGIPEDLLPRVFELFQQGERSLDRPEGGLGIGLTVVRWLTNLHGGTAEARSDGPGRGSEFIVRLPRARHGRIHLLE